MSARNWLVSSVRRLPVALGLLCVALAQPVEIALAATSTLTVAKSGSGNGLVSANSGAISCGGTCSGSYTDGSSVTLTAVPTAGNQFTGWLGPCTGTGACSFVVNGSATISATFAATPLIGPALDIDGEGRCDALSDGLLLIR